MIGWGDVCKVVEAMVPLYFALGLGYGSVRWWRVFTPEQCVAVNRLVAYFTLPFFTFGFAASVDPFAANYRLVGADAISKFLIVAVITAWARCRRKAGSYCWSITTFSLGTLTSSLVVGVPLLDAMYGKWSEELVVQLAVVQAIVWLTVLLFVMELRKAWRDADGMSRAIVRNASSYAVTDGDGGGESRVAAVGGAAPTGLVIKVEEEGREEVVRPSFRKVMKVVWLKLALNPNSYASIVGVTWAFIAKRWHFEMPNIMKDSVLIMSKAGTGMAMFSMGLFMAQQEKIIACGPGLAAFGMGLRFLAGPASMAIGSMVVGLRGDMLRVAIIQAAIPQSITSFIFAREYGLHAEVLSTAVIFGMLVSLPILVAYYAILGFMS